jgi:hypothetical protein
MGAAVNNQQMLRSVERIKARAIQATACQIDGQRRAINLQESSAIMFDRARQAGRSRNARQRADRARERLQRVIVNRNNGENPKAAK